MLGADEGRRKEGWRERENMRERYLRDNPGQATEVFLLFCLFAGAVEGLRQQICMGRTCRRRLVSEEGGWWPGRDKATCAQIGDGAAERDPLAEVCARARHCL